MLGKHPVMRVFSIAMFVAVVFTFGCDCGDEDSPSDSDATSDDDVDDDSNDDANDDSVNDDLNDDLDDDSDDDINDDANDDVDDDTDSPDDDIDDDTYECTSDSQCDDGVYCNGLEKCVVHTCYDGIPPCDDGIFCNGEEPCDEENGECSPSTGNPCPDDGLWCNGQEECDEDGDVCTHTLSPWDRCPDNGLYCDGAELCDEDADDCYSAGDPCAPDFPCDENAGACAMELAAQYLTGGRVAADRTSMEMGSDGSLYAVTTRLRDVVLFKRPGGGQEWSEEFIAENGAEAEIAVDESDFIHVVYEDIAQDRLMYATNASGLWETQVIAEDVFSCMPYIEVDPGGFVHVIYNDHGLLHATNESGQWVDEDIGVTYALGPYSVDMDAHGHLHCTYEFWMKPSSEFFYATNADGSWQHYSLHNGSLGHYAFAAASDEGDPNILVHTVDQYWTDDDDDLWGDDDQMYYEVSSLDYLYKADDDFVSENLAYSDSAWISNYEIPMDTDSAGKLHSCYTWKNSNSDFSYYYTTNMSGSWETEEVCSVSLSNTSLVVDDESKVHLTHAKNFSDLGCISNESGTWVDQTVGEGSWASQEMDMALDADGYSHIVYLDYKNKDLVYITDKSGVWVQNTVDSLGDVGRHPHIALDAGGHPYVSYQDFSNLNLKMARNLGTWEFFTVDSTDSVGRFNSIALGQNGEIYISYYNTSSGHPRLASYEDSAWSFRYIDDTHFYESGIYTSLAVDDGGCLHAAYCKLGSYYAEDCSELMYANNRSGQWEATVVDDSEDSGANAVLRIGPQGKVHIVYESDVQTGETYRKAISVWWM